VRIEQTCIDLLGSDRCTGCFACQTACPQGAIRLVLDAEGFYKPVVDRNVCDHCGLCQQHCPVLACDAGRLPSVKWTTPRAFAAWSSDETLRLASSSGGLFSELARPVIAAGGAVAGCVWGTDWTPRHLLAHTWAEVEKMRGSKYVPSKVGNIYAEVAEYLGRCSSPVLFVGTPCQVAALDLALSREHRERVLTVDLICAGVPSLRVFHRYLEYLFQGKQVLSFNFRDKSLGWSMFSVRAEAAGRRCYQSPAATDPFVAGFCQHRLYVMEACHACPFARLPRAGDITLGDFWGCPDQWNDKRGVSVALANTPAGLHALELLAQSGRIVLEPADLATATKGNPRLVTGEFPISTNRRAFLDDMIAGKKFRYLMSKYFPGKQKTWRSRWTHGNGLVARLVLVAIAALRKLKKLVDRCVLSRSKYGSGLQV